MKIIIEGDCPSKKNSRAFVPRGNQIISFPGAYYQQWNRDAQKQLMVYHKIWPQRVEITFFPKTRRAGDLSNKAESVMDALVQAGILEDDNWNVVKQLILNFGGVDPQRPRVEIYLT